MTTLATKSPVGAYNDDSFAPLLFSYCLVFGRIRWKDKIEVVERIAKVVLGLFVRETNSPRTKYCGKFLLGQNTLGNFSSDKILWRERSLFTCLDDPNLSSIHGHICLLSCNGQLLGSDSAGHQRGYQHTF